MQILLLLTALLLSLLTSFCYPILLHFSINIEINLSKFYLFDANQSQHARHTVCFALLVGKHTY